MKPPQAVPRRLSEFAPRCDKAATVRVLGICFDVLRDRQAMRCQGGFTNVPIVTYQLADEHYIDGQVQQLLTASARVYAEILDRRAEAH